MVKTLSAHLEHDVWVGAREWKATKHPKTLPSALVSNSYCKLKKVIAYDTTSYSSKMPYCLYVNFKCEEAERV
jgi:hypothetical protein